MKQREGFTRMTIEDVKAKRAELDIQRAVEETMESVDEQVTEHIEALAQELVDEGYGVDDFEIEVDHFYKDNKLIVHLKVVQVVRAYEFLLTREN